MEDLVMQISKMSPIVAVIVAGLFAYEKRISKLEIKLDHVQETLERILTRMDHAS